MKIKSVLPMVLLLAAIAALPLSRDMSRTHAAPLPAGSAVAGIWPATYTLPPPCDVNVDPNCITAGDITVAYDPAATCAADDPAWGAVITPTVFFVRQAWESYLYPQHVEAPPNLAGETALRRPMQVAAIRNDTDICFRMVWLDATQDLAVDDLTRYADAVAIMIPFGGEDIPGLDFQNNVCPDSFHMGGFPGLVGGGMWPGGVISTTLPDCVQNIVQWRPDQPVVRNLTAVGFSTSIVTSDSDTLPGWHWANWDGSYWDVIYKRPLVGASANQVSLLPGHHYPIAFATWDGAGEERDGRKFVTEDFDNNLDIP